MQRGSCATRTEYGNDAVLISAGRPYEGTLCQLGDSLMVLGDKACSGPTGFFFFGKIDNNLFIAWRMDVIKTL